MKILDGRIDLEFLSPFQQFDSGERLLLECYNWNSISFRKYQTCAKLHGGRDFGVVSPGVAKSWALVSLRF